VFFVKDVALLFLNPTPLLFSLELELCLPTGAGLMVVGLDPDLYLTLFF
jgi:hypothetical protein